MRVPVIRGNRIGHGHVDIGCHAWGDVDRDDEHEHTQRDVQFNSNGATILSSSRHNRHAGVQCGVRGTAALCMPGRTLPVRDYHPQYYYTVTAKPEQAQPKVLRLELFVSGCQRRMLHYPWLSPWRNDPFTVLRSGLLVWPATVAVFLADSDSTSVAKTRAESGPGLYMSISTVPK